MGPSAPLRVLLCSSVPVVEPGETPATHRSPLLANKAV